jgi:hypothetical protein
LESEILEFSLFFLIVLLFSYIALSALSNIPSLVSSFSKVVNHAAKERLMATGRQLKLNVKSLLLKNVLNFSNLS